MHGWEKSFEEEFVCSVHVSQKVASNEKDSATHTEKAVQDGVEQSFQKKSHLNLTGG